MKEKKDIPILVIDDEVLTLKTIKAMLSTFSEDIDTAQNISSARKLLKEKEYIIIICDDRLPDQTGLDFFLSLKKQFPAIMKILITAHKDFDRLKFAINRAEIFRFINKPLDIADLINAVDQAYKMWQLEKNERDFKAKLSKKNLELQTIYEQLRYEFDYSIQIFIQIVETFFPELGVHSSSTQKLSELIAEKLSLNNEETEIIRYAAALHDIGLLGIDRTILQKPEKDLTKEEYAILCSHPVIGNEIIGDQYDFKEIGKIIKYHHENFDGTGYPENLKGNIIPLGSRIIAVANYIDKQLYPIMTNQKDHSMISLIEKLNMNSDTLFDPLIIAIAEDILSGDDFYEKYLIHIPTTALKPGMITAMSVFLQSGAILFPKDTFLNISKIKEIQKFSKHDANLQRIFIYYKQSKSADV